jgi:acetylornithine deacetylase/succinyl-diaminopimelate desuccinylase-like protein
VVVGHRRQAVNEHAWGFVRAFAAVADTAFLNIVGIPAVSYGPGDIRVAHADDEYVLIDELVFDQDLRAAGDGLVRVRAGGRRR